MENMNFIFEMKIKNFKIFKLSWFKLLETIFVRPIQSIKTT